MIFSNPASTAGDERRRSGRIVAPPITYSIDGKQYVSVMAGWGGAFSKKTVSYGRLLTFTIGGTASLPARARPRTFSAIASNAKPEQIAAGERLFNTYCVRCHGGATIPVVAHDDQSLSPVAAL